jgi:NADH-quinone oxidoreductase subunit M
MNQLGGFPLLTIVVFLPMLGATVSALLPRNRPDANRWIALLTAATDLFVALFLPMGWLDDPTGAVQFADGPWPWLSAPGLNYYLGVDGISLHLVLLTTLLIPVIMIYDWTGRSAHPHRGETASGMLLLESALLGTLCALDLSALLTFWVLALLATAFLARRVTGKAGADRWLIAVGALVAVCALAVIAGFSSRAGSLDLPTLAAATLPWRAQGWIFWAAIVLCSLTMAAFPLHLWYPAASRALPVTMRVLLGSLLLNIGGYGLIRLCIQLLPLASTRFAPLVSAVGAVGFLYGALAALGQDDLAGALAYWRIAQSGLIITGIFAMQDTGLHGALLHLLACGLSSAALLLLCDAQARDRAAIPAPHPSQPSRLGMAVAFLSGMGLPGTVGFLGQAALLVQAIGGAWPASSAIGDWVWPTAILVGLLLSSGSLLRAWRRAAVTASRPLTQQTLVGLALPVLILLLGVYTTPISDAVGPTVFRLLEEAVDRVEREIAAIDPVPDVAATEPGPETPFARPGVAWHRTAVPLTRWGWASPVARRPLLSRQGAEL